MTQIVFTSRQDVVKFLKARHIEDNDLRWVCPECGTLNIGAYYSHGSPCGGCDKFVFPRLNLKHILESDEEAAEIARQIKNYSGKIEHQKDVVADLRDDLSTEERRLDDLREELHQLKVCDMGKVKW